ncbi:TM2 domain-containing protein [Sanguibacter sp. 25GB23B1]|uniref:TM2 domain-containing protein n=1 Tax=unclassified Sanguibacter TaxID=2645534 RepID=UPI0032AF701D
MSTTPSESQPDHDKLPPADRPAWMQEPYGAPQAPTPAGSAPDTQSPYGAGQTYQQQPYQPGYAGGPQGYPGGPGGPWAQQDPTAKSRMAAGLLGIFLGSLGVHRFYLGYTGIGVVMLLITVLSFGLLSWVSGIWGLIEGILYLTDKTGSYSRDASGRPLRD